MADMPSKEDEENVIYTEDMELKRDKRILKIFRMFEEDKKARKAIPPRICIRKPGDDDFDYPDKEIEKTCESAGGGVIQNPIMDAIRADPEALAFHTQRRLKLLEFKSDDHLPFSTVEDLGPFTKKNRIHRRPR